ncbi:MAG TPA: hypothetical protein VKU80_14735 [Planctomycetota bacterium]|nr:hypothetical protein [Planctomycetota bacterium]
MLRYESAGKVGVSAVRSILKEIGSIQRTWWRGALGLDVSEEGRPAILSGETPLFHAHGIPDDEDVFMSFTDAAFIVGRLADWGRRFRIKWRIWMNHEDWGSIDPVGLTKPLRDQMGKWSGRAGVFESGPGTWRIPEERRMALLARHANRKEL